ncbi:3-deoxy-D-manno-octulosonic acid transferase [Bradyrhizobium sp. LHD-71]|uniref:3-deoxy-D-manno-octulosonic acid transferase n=1 Tax=Bradyrhizobium sp. LHD-71 TaxID=3072141 RepID=UPI00280F2A46|nr:3-deoxy-D-manno-octulosonic acid transferase [Bradyrhizobium sp. LHD-71]MDQ8726807.1 3-deoxy-D-manno-octulosonic acid transferase [Bradyrhizobium sp. LHD-71]
MASDLPLTLRMYRGLSTVAGPLAGALVRHRLKRGKEDEARVGERKGLTVAARPAGPLVWIHGASVGEVLAVAGLVERMRAMNICILLTSGTVTSAAIVAKRFPRDVIHQFVPYDSPRFVARFLDHWQPSFAMFVESDLWPNLILSSAARRIPMILVNGRMSPRSFRRWQSAPATMAALLGQFEMCLVQSPGDAERFSALGGPHVFNTGNLKFDVPAPPADPQKLALLRRVMQGRPILLASSTHAGEEEFVLDAHRRLVVHFPELLTIIVPRHPDRGPQVAQLTEAAGLRVAVRSRGELPSPDADIYLADTLGELGLFYRLSPIVFVGGSLVNHGGQNPIEPIKLGAAVLHGPHVANFADIYRALDEAGGARLAADREALVKQMGGWLDDGGARQRASVAGRAVVDRLGGALDKTMAALEPYLLQLRLESGSMHA